MQADEVGHRGSLPSGEYEAIDAFEIRRTANANCLRAARVQVRDVLAKIALNGEDADAGG